MNIRADIQRRITDTLEIAQKMGGTVILLKNEDVADALISFAKEYGITHIVLGRPSAKKIPNPFKRSYTRDSSASFPRCRSWWLEVASSFEGQTHR